MLLLYQFTLLLTLLILLPLPPPTAPLPISTTITPSSTQSSPPSHREPQNVQVHQPSLTILSPRIDGVEVTTDQITVAVLVRLPSAYLGSIKSTERTVRVCLMINGVNEGCKHVLPQHSHKTANPVGVEPPPSLVEVVNFELSHGGVGGYVYYAIAEVGVEGGGRVVTESESRSFTVLPPSSCTPPSSPPLIVDGFTFNNEATMLLLRLSTLSPHVDRFILVESTVTFQGAPKATKWRDELKDDPRFKLYVDKIDHVVVESFPVEASTAWDREYHQRDMITSYALDNFDRDKTVVMVSDVDEIPDPRAIEVFRGCGVAGRSVITLRAEYYYYNFNWRKEGWWYGIQVSTLNLFEKGEFGGSNVRRILGYGGGVRSGEVKAPDFSDLDLGRVDTVGMLYGGGWHLSYFLTDVEEVLDKVGSFSHVEYNNKGIRRAIEDGWGDIVGEGKDLFGRDWEEGERLVWQSTTEALHKIPPLSPSFPSFFQPGNSPPSSGGGIKVEDWGREDGKFKPLHFELLRGEYRHGRNVGGNGKYCSWDGSGGKGVSFAFGIVSAVGNWERRQLIRDTWIGHNELREFQDSGRRWEYVFILGLSPTSTIPQSILDEMNAHHDILIVNVVDSYKNMIHKVVAGLRWGKGCGAEYVGRVNDDVYLRFGAVLNTLFNDVVPSNVYAGWFLDDVLVLRPEDETAVKGTEAYTKSSMIEREVYPSDVYPVFAQGNGYIISGNVVDGLTDWIVGRRERFADDIMVGLYMDGVMPTMVLIPTDFKSDNGGFGCSREAVWHFDVGMEDMRRLWENDIGKGKGQCDGL